MMTPATRVNSALRTNGAQGRLLRTVRQVSETIGAEFFAILADELRGALDAECVYIGEFVGGKTERVRLIAVSMKTDQMEVVEFPLADSPDTQVKSGNPSVFARGVREIFPDDRLSRDLQIEARVGVPLSNPEGQAAGVLAALFREELDLEIYFVQSILNAFVPRAAAELNRKEADDALHESEERYHAFIQSSPDACWRIEFDEPIETALPEDEQIARILRSGRIVEGNDALARRLGLERPGDLIGAAMTDFDLDMQNAQVCVRALIRSGYRRGTIEIPGNAVGKRGNFVYTSWGIVEDGRLVRIWGTSRDTTELRQLEAQFLHAQKLESIGRLAAGVAHDFNNLLMIIQGYTSELLDRIEISDPLYTGLAEIQKAAARCAALGTKLTAFSRKQNLKSELLDLTRIVAEDEEMLRSLLGKTVELVTELGASAGLVLADAGSMHQVLLNLAVNARDAMPDGGRLIVKVAKADIEENRPARLATVEPGSYVELSVADNGTGMTPEAEEHLFEPFFTTKDATLGTGLGLSTAYGIIRQSGGHIVVETEPNKGTTFTIYLPRVKA